MTIQPHVNSALAQRLPSCLLSGGERIPLSSDIIVDDLSATIRLVFETISTLIGSNRRPLRSSAKYCFAATVPATFHMQPLRKHREPQQNSFSFQSFDRSNIAKRLAELSRRWLVRRV